MWYILRRQRTNGFRDGSFPQDIVENVARAFYWIKKNRSCVQRAVLQSGRADGRFVQSNCCFCFPSLRIRVTLGNTKTYECVRMYTCDDAYSLRAYLVRQNSTTASRTPRALTPQDQVAKVHNMIPSDLQNVLRDNVILLLLHAMAKARAFHL